MMRTLVAKVAVAALVSGAVSLSGATVASATPTGDAAPRTALTCEFYLSSVGYTVGPKVMGACDTAEDGFPGACTILLADIGVTEAHAKRACELGVQR